jgi:uncharacterized protein YijF (DUF1287 family)
MPGSGTDLLGDEFTQMRAWFTARHPRVARSGAPARYRAFEYATWRVTQGLSPIATVAEYRSLTGKTQVDAGHIRRGLADSRAYLATARN